MTKALPESLVVFGTGARGRLCKTRLKRLGVRMPTFANNAAANHGTLIDGIPVPSPRPRCRQWASGVPVIACSFALSEIQEQLFVLSAPHLL